MRLTGKAKEDFEKWYSENVEFKGEVLYLEEFYILPFSMQYGVLVDWFDSVGVYILIKRLYSIPMENDVWYFIITNKEGVYFNSTLDKENKSETRPQARQKAIEKANEIYNKRD
jgi:hypothetical protein